MPIEKSRTKWTRPRPTPLQVAVADALIECRAGPGTIRAFSRSQLVLLLDRLIGGRCTYEGDCVNINTSGLNIFAECLGDICIDSVFENMSNVRVDASSLDKIREAAKSAFTVAAEFECELNEDPSKDLKPRKKFVRLVLEPKEAG